MIKLIATDIDGTLLEDGTLNLDPEYITVIRKLVEKGIIFVICSGRQFVSEQKLFSEIQDQLYFISDGGAVVRTAGEILQVYRLKVEVWKAMYEDASKLPECETLLCLPDYCMAENPDSPMFHWLLDSYGFDVRHHAPLGDVESPDVIKFTVYHQYACEEKCSPAFIPKYKDLADLSIAGKEWLDCIPKGVNKGTAVRWLQDRLGIRREETLCFGDNLNDIGMFRAAGESYAVANAREEVKCAATGTVAPYWENGVLNFLKESFGLD